MAEKPPAFVDAVCNLLKGVHEVRGFLRVLLRDAAEECLLGVAKKHCLDFASLVDTFRDPIVETYTRLADTRGQCTTTKKNKRCSARPVLGDVCVRHADERAEQSTKRRKLDAHAARRRATGASHVDALVRECTDPPAEVNVPDPVAVRALLI